MAGRQYDFILMLAFRDKFGFLPRIEIFFEGIIGSFFLLSFKTGASLLVCF